MKLDQLIPPKFILQLISKNNIGGPVLNCCLSCFLRAMNLSSENRFDEDGKFCAKTLHINSKLGRYCERYKKVRT
jgi:hypothetical protein